MPDREHREIPFNYTSASDEQIVTFLFGAETWAVLEQLRARRVTGRSARLLLRFMGDMFVLRRNPFLWQQLVDSPRRRRELVTLARRDLDIVERNARDEELVSQLIDTCRNYLGTVVRELGAARRQRQRVRRALGAVIGEDNVTFDPFALVSHATDATDWRLCLPLCVARPAREADVAPLLAAIARLRLHAIPRGAGTGLTGGAVPLLADCVMVNTERLDRIRGVTERDFVLDGGERRRAAVMEVEAGVVTETAMAEAERRGLVFATDPTSAWACTVGGNLAENAGGKSAVLWGTAIDNVLAWQMALPSGATCRVERVGHPLRKIQPNDVVRFAVRTSDGGAGGSLDHTIDLRGDEIRKPNLWKDITNKALGGVPGLQKEGTDGVITSAEFVLHHAYPESLTACLEFFGESMDEAARVILDIAGQFPNRGEEALQALEHFDEEYVRAIDYRTKAARDARPKAVLLIDMVAHTQDQLARGRERLAKLLSPYPDTHVFFARDAAEAASFWADRKKLGAIAKRTNAFKLNEDIVLPLAALAEFARYLDFCNVSEDRENQLACVSRVRATVAEASPKGGEWLAQKLPAAIERCARAAADLRDATADDLRRLRHVRRLERDLAALFAGYETVEKELGRAIAEERSRLIVIATHMHAGDGNVHVNIPVFSNDREMMRRAAQVADSVMAHAVRLHGVVSGEHGIGITKLKHLEQAAVDALAAHRARVDPAGLMNPRKLADRAVLDHVFTPSFNLLELEAKILQVDQLHALADKISKCVRCGKCKPNCCVYYPGQSLFYHPRNKNLAIGSLVEALLYEAQRFRTTDFESLAYLEDVADHCTICHKCLEPCPVKIDTGEVSILEREILVARGTKRTALPTRLVLAYLDSTNRAFTAGFRYLGLRLGTEAQRLGTRMVRALGAPAALTGRWPLALLRSPVTAPAAAPLHRALPDYHGSQALVIEPALPPERTVFYFPGCGSERLHSDVGKAAIFLLLGARCRVVLPPPLLCCGFPSGANAKTRMHARKVLSDTIVFSQIRGMLSHLAFDAVAVSCGTCLESLHAMGAHEIFACPLVDVGELALAHGAPPPAAGRLLYHRPCHDSTAGRAPRLLAQGGATVDSVPHCCSEAGTLALSRPDIAHKMLARKRSALAQAADGERPLPFVTNCPSCLQGLGRQEHPGAEPVHLAVLLARKQGGDEWQATLGQAMARTEVVNF
jgi:FAD/FMN-containing dehydrogenase/Fe-S oxidoreductase